MTIRSFLAAALTAAVPLVIVPDPAAAQEEDDGPWEVDGEVGVSVFFGASEQTTISVRSAAERASELLEFSFGVGFAYGEAQPSSGGDSFVSKRSWQAETALDYKPEGTVSPFVFGSAEGSLERQIDLRLSGGLGAKYSFVRTEQSRLDISLAALVERTDPRTPEGDFPVEDEIETQGRWSARFRASHDFADERTSFSFVTFYRPSFDDRDDYTVDLETSLAYSLTETVGLKLSFLEKYDSLAEERGAASNHDGRIFFSILATAG